MQVIEEGWLVVRAQYFKFEPDAKHPKGWRGYSLLSEERLLVVNAMLRLGGIKFEAAPRRNLRPNAGGGASAGGGRGRGGQGGPGGRGGRGPGGARGRGGAPNKAPAPAVRQELWWFGSDSHNLVMGCVRDAKP